MKQNLNEYLILEQLESEIKDNLMFNKKECEKKILDALKKYPHAPQPQNLLGILSEKMDDDVQAMAHYRAAYALAPYYRPSRYNMDRYAEFHPKKDCFFTDEDCDKADEKKKKMSKEIIKNEKR